MIKILTTQLFTEQLARIGKAKSQIALNNFIAVEKAFEYVLRYINLHNMSMVVKVKDSAYSIKYTYNKQENALRAIKLLE